MIPKQTLKNRQSKSSLQHEQTRPFYLHWILSLTTIHLRTKVSPLRPRQKKIQKKKVPKNLSPPGLKSSELAINPEPDRPKMEGTCAYAHHIPRGADPVYVEAKQTPARLQCDCDLGRRNCLYSYSTCCIIQVCGTGIHTGSYIMSVLLTAL